MSATTVTARRARRLELGLRRNIAQFSLLVAVNALVGGLLGEERTVVPLLAGRVFGITGYTASLTYIAAFGAVKAATNYLAGLEPATHNPRDDGRHDVMRADLSSREVFAQTTLHEPALSSASQAGLVNNLNDGLAWGLFPVLFAGAGISLSGVGVLVAIY